MKKTILYPSLKWLFTLFIFLGCTKTINTPLSPPNNPPISSVTVVPVDSASVIYLAAGYSNDLFALNAANGNIIWSSKVKGFYNTSAIYSQGNILVKGYDNGQSEDVSAYDTLGKLRWIFHMPGNNETPAHMPVIASGGVVYTQDLEHIYAIHISDGTVKWTFEKSAYGYGNGTLILKNHTLYVNSAYGVFNAVDQETGVLKWMVDTQMESGIPFISDDSIFLANGAEIQILDAHTGDVKKDLTSFATGGPINIKYGRIYSFDGRSTDSATCTLPYPFFSFAARMQPEGATLPIVADSLVILPYGVYNAFTGQLVCMPYSLFDEGSFGGYLCGATYVSHILYYTTGEREAYDAGGGGHYFSDVYAYDIPNNKLLWHTAIEGTNIFNVEPCVVTRSGAVFRGIYTFQ